VAPSSPQLPRRHATGDEGAAVVVVPATLFDTIGDRLLERVR